MVFTIPGIVSQRMRTVMLLSLTVWIFLLWILIETLTKPLPEMLVNGSVERWLSYLLIAVFTMFWIWHGFTLLRALLRRWGSREIVRLTPVEIMITRKAVWGERHYRCSIRDIREVNLAKVVQEPLVAGRSGKILFRAAVTGPVRFQLAERDVTVGLDLDDEEAKRLLSLIQAQLALWKRST
jgi:hypothetical protein